MIWIGANKNSLAKRMGLEWYTGVKMQGIHFLCDQEKVIEQNFHERLSDIQKMINQS